MRSFEFHPAAQAEAAEAVLYYLAIRKRLAIDFRSELRTAINRARRNPFLYPADDTQLRVVSLSRFPYLIVFEIVDNRVWIAAIAHTSRRSGYWPRRRFDNH